MFLFYRCSKNLLFTAQPLPSRKLAEITSIWSTKDQIYISKAYQSYQYTTDIGENALKLSLSKQVEKFHHQEL